MRDLFEKQPMGDPREALWRRLTVPMVTLLALLVLDRLLLEVPVLPPSTPAFIVLVVYASLVGGLAGGLISSAVIVIYAAFILLVPGRDVLFKPQPESLVILALTSVTITVAVGFLKRSWERTSQAAQKSDQARLEVEAKLTEQRELLQALMDHTPDAAYYTKDLEGRFTKINEGLASILGLHDSAQAVGKTDADFYKPEYVESSRADEEQVLKTDKPIVGNVERQVFLDGREKWMLTTKMPLRDKDGTLTGVFGLSRDITELKRSEEALRLSEERVRTLLEGIDDALFVHDREGHILDCNEAACRRLGYTREELLSKTTEDVDAPEFADGFYERLAQQAAQGRSRFEGVHVTKDGRRIAVDISTSVISYQGRGAVLAVMRDITRRKEMEEALRQAEASYHSLIEQLPQGVSRKDLEGKFTYANQKFCSLLGESLLGLLGKTDFDFFHRPLAEELQEQEKKVIETGKPFRGDREYQLPNGEKRIFHVTQMAIRDSQGKVIGLQGIVDDAN